MNSLKTYATIASVLATLVIFVVINWIFYQDQIDFIQEDQYENLADYSVLALKNENSDPLLELAPFFGVVDFWKSHKPITYGIGSVHESSDLTELLGKKLNQENINWKDIVIKTLSPDVQTPDELLTLLEDAQPHEAIKVISIVISNTESLNIVSVFDAQNVVVWDQELIIMTLLLLLFMLAINLWIISLVSQPIVQLSRAVKQFGKDLRPLPLPEKGIDELVVASRAFNQMQQQITQLIKGRTQMLAAISHDIRTPVTRLKLRAALLEDEQLQGKIEADLDEITSMLDATLSFLRNDALVEDPVRMHFSQWLTDYCEQRIQLGDAIEIKQVTNCYWHIRPLAMQRVLDNIINNALKYGEHASIELVKKEESIQLSVQDKGKGIPEHLIKQVTKPFVRVDKARNKNMGGSGLGLAIVESIVQLHHGELTLYNTAQGLRVEVTLPL